MLAGVFGTFAGGGISLQYRLASAAAARPVRRHRRSKAAARGNRECLSRACYSSRGRPRDHHPIDGVTAVSPEASASIALSAGTRVQPGFGQYLQYPELTLSTPPPGSRALLPLRPHQLIAAVERRLSARAFLRVEYCNRADRDLLFQPLYDPRLAGGMPFVPPSNPPDLKCPARVVAWARGVRAARQRQPLHWLGAFTRSAELVCAMVATAIIFRQRSAPCD
jgi:hypothetical protein